MPLAWTITISASAALFLLASWFVLQRTPWLSAYFILCAAGSFIWVLQDLDFSRTVRPVILLVQTMAVLESIELLHRNCWAPRRRYLLAGFCGLCAIGLSLTAVSYPKYPELMWRVQMGIEAASVAALVVSLGVLRWWNNYTPSPGAVASSFTLMVYCAAEVGAMLFQCLPRRFFTLENWIGVDVTLALVQDCCLLWWIVLSRGNAEPVLDLRYRVQGNV
jgi:hypothetical protein